LLLFLQKKKILLSGPNDTRITTAGELANSPS
jgi:hypothetical protein